MGRMKRTSSNLQQNFFRKVLLAMVLVIVVVFLIIAYLMRMLLTNTIATTFHTNLILLAAQEDEVRADPEGFVRHYAASFSSVEREARLIIMDEKGLVIADSGLPSEQILPHTEGYNLSRQPDVRAALSEGWGLSPLREGFFDVASRPAASYYNGEFIYRMSLPGTSLTQIRNNLLGALLLSFGIAMLIAFVIATYLGSRFTRPVLSLKRQAQRLAEGDFAEPTHLMQEPEEHFTDELRELNDSFRVMRAQLERAYLEINRSNETLTAILQSINDGVLAVDAEGQVMLLTDRAEEYLGETADRTAVGETGGGTRTETEHTLSLLGTNYAHVSQILSETMREGKRISATLRIPGSREQVLEVSAAPLSALNERGAVAVIHDASRMKQLERMRHDFVANVSHELKTPLTSIRGYIDLLRTRERDPETVQQFYDIIDIEADRLQNLIGDLLDLSEIESGMEVRKEQIYLFQVVDEVMSQMVPMADKRDVRLVVDVDPALQVNADFFRMRQLLTNLVSNGVAYNRPGGTVTIRGRSERDMAIIQVEDTGIGIPAEAQERIFERFYRVSRDRSREAGGTGLGLSIVKHIAGLFGGTIELQSEMGVGTVFTVRIPQVRQA